MTETLRKKILNSLIKNFNISKKDLESARALQKTKNISLDRALIEKRLIEEEDLMVLLVKELHIPFINLKKYRFDEALKTIVPERMARQYQLIPLSRLENTITVAMSDPLNIFAVDDLKTITGSDIDVVMSTSSDIQQAIENVYGSKLSSSVQEMSKDMTLNEFEIISEREEDALEEMGADEAEQAPIIRMVNLVIREGLKQRASDIHIEPMVDQVRVRYRIDGVLQEAMAIPKANQNSVMVRIKIMSGLDITMAREPQDGRFKLRLSGSEVDFRVSFLPTTFGQKAVLRVLDKKNLGIGLDGLGFSPEAETKIKDGVSQPFGMILVTGPTGSGKSTTLYSIINALNTVEKNIITVEDPVEYLVNGLTQIHVRPEIGLTFASGLKAILRQSPDIVMVGEIRDFETADIAIKASLTGQLVFSTLHTNDAAGALTRLVDMGVEPFLVASSLIMVCAQRLCRKVCPQCKDVEKISDRVLRDLHFEGGSKQKFYHGKGCSYCRQTGYRGRIGISEVLAIDEHVREMLIMGKASDEIKAYARQHLGLKTLWDDAMAKCLQGETTVEEVLRVTSDD